MSRPETTPDPEDSAEFSLSPTPEIARKDPADPASLIQLERRGVTSQTVIGKPKGSQAEFWANHRHWKDTIAAKLRELGTPEALELAAGLDECHATRTHAVCGHCGSSHPFYNRCDNSFCPCCQPRLARDRRDGVEFWVKQIAQPKHVVLTCRNSDTFTKERVKWFKDCWTKLRRRSFAKGWRGGFYSLEVTNEGKGWHLHLHALIDADWIDARQLSAQWGEVTKGEGHIVKVRDCREKSYLQEVTKYAVKGSQMAQWPPGEILAFIKAFDGVRQFGVFGSLMGKRAEFRAHIEGLADRGMCQACGGENIKFYSDDELEAYQGGLLQHKPPHLRPGFPHTSSATPPPDPQGQLFAVTR